MDKINTIEKLIIVSKEKFGENSFDYSKAIFINSKIKITFICKKHNKEFLSTSRDHLVSLSGCCPNCIIENKNTLSKSLTKPLEVFIKEVNIIHNYKYLYNNFKYVNDRSKSFITCLIHRRFFMLSW